MVAVEGEEPHDGAVLDRHPRRPLVGDDGGEVVAGLVVGVGELDVGEGLVEGAEVDLGDGGAVVGAGRTQHGRTVRSRAP